MADPHPPAVRTGGRTPSRPARRWSVAGALALALLGSACAADGDALQATLVPDAVTTTIPGASSNPSLPVAPSTTARSPLAALITPAGSTLYDPTAHTAGSPPVGLTVAGVGVRDAAVVDVGVQRNGELEVPAADQVGWYRFGPRPGEQGSSVLAAHIAFDGVDGVFRRLASVAPGAEVTVRFADGASRTFRVTSIERYDKDELPPRLFATTGPAQLVLITCGGAFNRELQSYEDNIVVTALPVVP